MLIIVQNHRWVSSAEIHRLACTIHARMGVDISILRHDDPLQPPLQFFSLMQDAKEVDVEELKAILTAHLPVKPWPQRMWEWWQARKNVASVANTP